MPQNTDAKLLLFQPVNFSHTLPKKTSVQLTYVQLEIYKYTVD